MSSPDRDAGTRCADRIQVASDGPHPIRLLLLGPALVTQGTGTACCFGCSIYMRAHTVLPVFHDMESESFASGTEIDIVLSVIGKRTTDKDSVTAMGVIFHRSPGILPGTKEVDTSCCSSLHGRMVGMTMRYDDAGQTK